ncbi:hypothetical protein [Enterovibrio norvegicus]|uniref:hypothetical protein n=1 Tax=Enterovibrio norvegicus TaxID=188144 RepID=UPI0024B0B98D|nr:hypothetical protein [Enterovibrio norvegicus]
MEQNVQMANAPVSGQFVDFQGDRFYRIENVDHMQPFFMSIVSANDHWLFVSSTGSLSAGRSKPENALFPYRSVDMIHESADNTGPKTFIRVDHQGTRVTWEPFNVQQDGRFELNRHLYKNITGDKLVFEEVNHTLGLSFQYSWETGNTFGFVRRCEIANLRGEQRNVEVLDGLQNILPCDAPMAALQTRSALVDAYKWNERVGETALALFTMYAKLSDRADPAESLQANTVFCVDSDQSTLLLSSQQLPAFRRGQALEPEMLTRGVRGAYMINKNITLDANSSNDWLFVLDSDKNHTDVAVLRSKLARGRILLDLIEDDIQANRKELVALIGAVDGWQYSASETTSNHHYANVLFNSMRGGVFENGYALRRDDVLRTARATNGKVVLRNQSFYDALPEQFTHAELVKRAEQSDDIQLVRLCLEYLPLTFGRRHGDPSRPWNHYEIKVKDKQDQPLLSYQGNWRDIFQNWEALALSYPGYIRAFITKFVNASTLDGYNPYRITKDGVDWEVLEADDPWSNIGYWGDHQIIYLLKFLEWSKRFDPEQLSEDLTREIFSYANVPYRIGDANTLFNTPKDTVTFDQALHDRTVLLSEQLGSDGRLMLDSDKEVYLVNLSEKLLVPLLAKLSNWVVDGGIWLNTQRPEWNDANNAIVGNGLSVVTLCYMRRYVEFLQGLFANAPDTIRLSTEVAQWLSDTADILHKASTEVKNKTVTRQTKRVLLNDLVEAACRYRRLVYRDNGFSGKTTVSKSDIDALLDSSMRLLDRSALNNEREDGLYNAYNVVQYSSESLASLDLYPMLEGQVAALSSGALSSSQSVSLLDSLFKSEMYRADQKSFMLYPDRELSTFMDKNLIPAEKVQGNPLLSEMYTVGDTRLINVDNRSHFHFNASFENDGVLKRAIETVRPDYPHITDALFNNVLEIYEEVFNHREFTGRSGTMFGYEGLGCIYWHMVSKLLLAVQEVYFTSLQENPHSQDTKKLAAYYYRVRDGIGFNKAPQEYGAFPVDPYSHTPKNAGAQQPGMTGQVKEEILTRFGELGIMVSGGAIEIAPTLLLKNEFSEGPVGFTYVGLDSNLVDLELNKGELAFTYCQVPFVYRMSDAEEISIELVLSTGDVIIIQGNMLSASISKQIFDRTGEFGRIVVNVPESMLYQPE